MRATLASATSLLALLLASNQEASGTTLLAFGNILVGQTSGTDTITETGASGSRLQIAAPGTPFGGAAIDQVFASNTQTVTGSYTFSPLAAGAASATTPILNNGATVDTLSLTGTGVAPVASGPASSATFGTYALVGSTISGASLNVNNNAGTGNLAGTGGIYNLNGSITGGNSVFVGTPQSFSLTDNSKGVVSTSSRSFGYTFTPVTAGTAGLQSQTATVTTTFTNGGTIAGSINGGSTVTTTLTATAVAPVQSVDTTAATVYARAGSSAPAAITISNVGHGNLSGLGTVSNLNVSSVTASLGSKFTGGTGTLPSLADGGSTTLGYTYTPVSRGTSATATVSVSFANGNAAGTNLSDSVVSTLTGTGVGPVYASSIKGGAVSTPSAGANGSIIAPSKTIQFGSVGYKVSQTVYLELQNTSTDANGGVASLTNLSILKYSIAGGASSAFSVPTGLSGVLAENNAGVIEIPITVIGNSTIGSLNDTLTIFTDEAVGYGGTGDTFTYALTAFSVPEPASLVALGAGLAGLASVRRRRIATKA